jgi:hypothetical protein
VIRSTAISTVYHFALIEGGGFGHMRAVKQFNHFLGLYRFFVQQRILEIFEFMQINFDYRPGAISGLGNQGFNFIIDAFGGLV